MEGLLGEIRLWISNRVPEGWAVCNGQTLQIKDNPALYSLITTRYGGDGTTTFVLPNFNNATAMGVQGYAQKDIMKGSQTVVIESKNIPPLYGQLNMVDGGDVGVEVATPDSRINADAAFIEEGEPVTNLFADFEEATNKILENNSVAYVNENPKPISTYQPSLGMKYIICVKGNYPPRS